MKKYTYFFVQLSNVRLFLFISLIVLGAALIGSAGSEAAPDDSQIIFLPAVLEGAVNCTDVGEAYDALVETAVASDISAQLTGTAAKWHPITLTFNGPFADERDKDPNPFLDYRLQVYFAGPGGQIYNVPGFFAGDGNGNGNGRAWQVRFAPDEPGQWHYVASFRRGADVAVNLDPHAGHAAGFDCAGGAFTVADRDPDAPGFLKWGRLEYVGEHYLKFRDGDYWIKGGANSPENFLAYLGFDNTHDQGGIVYPFLHGYPDHIGDWRPGDPNFVSRDTGYDAKGIIGALNYLADNHVNSIYFLPMNLGGDGQDTYPFIYPSGADFANTHYDISKLHQWNIVLNHAQEQGIAVHMVLNETEAPNRNWLDDGELGVERSLFYRELIARYGYLLALKWNLSEENVFTIPQIQTFADYIRTLDWAQHQITVHTLANSFEDYEQIVGDPRFTTTSIQYLDHLAGNYVEQWRQESSSAGWPWVIDMDENNPHWEGLTPTNADELRKETLYDVYFSGGNIEWYAGYYDLPVGGDMRLENFRTRQAMWDYMWYARRFMETHLPFWQMIPADYLLIGETEDFGGGEVFALYDQVYAVYLPNTFPGATLMLPNVRGDFTLRWFNPRTGLFEGGEQNLNLQQDMLALGTPPFDPYEDWVVLLTRDGYTPPSP